jgi:4'-phosphopantetheinyl transferase
MNAGPRSPLPPDGTVDVWRIALDLPASTRTRLVANLDDDERRLAARMRLGGERWAVAHAARREILARCCGVAAHALRFGAEPNGKPYVLGFPHVHFNTTAREGLGLLAIATAPLGVDVERTDIPGELTEAARRFLPQDVHEAIVASPVAERSRRFAIAWTRFEAMRKLRGVGIGELPPDREQPWIGTVREVDVPEGFVAAVAAEGDGWAVRLREAADVLGAN